MDRSSCPTASRANASCRLARVRVDWCLVRGAGPTCGSAQTWCFARSGEQHDLTVDRAQRQKSLPHRRGSGMLVEYDQDQLRPAVRCIVSIHSHSCDCALRTLVVVTYCACCQNITWHERLSLRHGLEKIGNAEDQIICRGILTQLSVHMGLHSQDFV